MVLPKVYILSMSSAAHTEASHSPLNYMYQMTSPPNPPQMLQECSDHGFHPDVQRAAASRHPGAVPPPWLGADRHGWKLCNTHPRTERGGLPPGRRGLNI